MKITRSSTEDTTTIAIEADVRKYQTLAFAMAHRAMFAFGWTQDQVVAINEKLIEALELTDEEIAKVISTNAAKAAAAGGEDEVIDVFVESWFAWHGVSVATNLIRKSLAEIN